MSKNSIMINISAGSVDRINEMVSFSLKPKLLFDNWQEGTSRLAMSQLNEKNEVISEYWKRKELFVHGMPIIAHASLISII